MVYFNNVETPQTTKYVCNEISTVFLVSDFKNQDNPANHKNNWRSQVARNTN